MRRLAALVLLATACGGDPRTGGPGETVVVTQAPPGTDVWLATLTRGARGQLAIDDPVNVTRRSGYDNQPFFLPDGSAFLYTVIDQAGQADIWRYELAEGAARPVTRTAPESEYSGTPLPDGGLSAVRVEADSTQRLWRFDEDGSSATPIFEDIEPIGYHAWAGDSTVALYVLGEPPSLVVARIGDGPPRKVAEDIGRSLRSIPGGDDISFVQRLADGSTEIRRLQVASGTSERLVHGVEGGDFHAWTPDGVLLQAHEASVYAWRPGGDWVRIADLSDLGIRISRIAVSPDGSRIALVGEAGS